MFLVARVERLLRKGQLQQAAAPAAAGAGRVGAVGAERKVELGPTTSFYYAYNASDLLARSPARLLWPWLGLA